MIRLDKITKQNGRQLVFIEASAALQRGEKAGLVGPNGAGKTTLLRVLAGLIVPTQGQVTLDSRPLSGLAREERARRIAALFQGAGVGWPMTVREIVALGRLPHRALSHPRPRPTMSRWRGR